MRLGEVGVEFQRLVTGLVGLAEFLVRAGGVPEQERAGVRDAGIRHRIVRIQFDGTLVHLPRQFEVFAIEDVEVLAASQVEVIGLDVAGGHVLDRATLLGAQGHFQRLDDALRDIVLDREDVLHRAVVSLGPQPVTVRHVDQLGRDAQSVPRLAHAPLEHRVDVEPPAHLVDVEALARELESRGARGHA